MRYTTIDPIIKNWEEKHGLQITNEYKDYEVRTVDLVDQYGNKYQIWIDPPDDENNIFVHAWDYKNKRIDINSSIDDLYDTLEKIYNTVKVWINTQQ